MRMTPGKRSAVALHLVLAGLLMAAGSAGADGVAVALTPCTIQVNPGDVFELDIWVVQPGTPFNGFDAIIGWDPAALTPISHAEGSLMTEACGNTFHRFRAGASADTIADVLLCNGVSLLGPGQIYKFQFQASTTPQVTSVQFLPGLQFYDDGLFVPLGSARDASVGIGMTPVGAGPSPTPARLWLGIAPNPAPGRTVFTIEADRAGPQRLQVMDIRGRVVRRFDEPAGTAGARTVAWDGRDAEGRRLPSGVYLVTLEVAGKLVCDRVALLR